MLTSEVLETRLKQDHRPLYFACRTLQKMKGEAVDGYASEILGFLSYQHPDVDIIGEYIRRSENLEERRKIFEKQKRYQQSTYADVEPIPDHRYKIALLLSFITTHHRFEILQQLVRFLQIPASGDQRVLSVGFGTGYEIKLAYDHAGECSIDAYDTSETAYDYASNLLGYFGYPSECLQVSSFPLESGETLADYAGRYDKIILCELLEHLEQPAAAIRRAATALSDRGRMFLTFAVNIPQEDHISLYRSADEARDQVLDAGLTVEQELYTPVSVLPFGEDVRNGLKKGNYVCVVSRQ